MEITITIKLDDAEIERKVISDKDDRTSLSQYARFFDETSPNWTKYSETNLMFLKLMQNHCNDLLKARGYIFLNEVYEKLGIPKTKAGQLVGWVYDEKNPIGDNYIDFGIFNVNNRQSVNGYENAILLDFNVDGVILDKIK